MYRQFVLILECNFDNPPIKNKKENFKKVQKYDEEKINGKKENVLNSRYSSFMTKLATVWMQFAKI